MVKFMRKIIVSVVIMFLLLFIMIEIIFSSTSIMDTISFSFDIWKHNIFPSLFPFFVLSDFLINYGFIELVSEFFKPIMNRFFKVSGVGAFVFIMSLVSGFPSNSKYVRELYLNGLINEFEGTKLLTFTHFSNPLFILGTISILFLNNREIGFLILLCHYFGNVIVGFLFRNYYISDCEKTKISFKRAILGMHNKRVSNNKSFGEIMTSSLMTGINTLLLIFGIITLFLVLTTIISNNLSLPPYYRSILNGIIEMTQGLKYVSLLDIPLKIKGTLSVMFISFGGISVHIQLLSIISDTKIKYFPFFIARVIHACLSSLIFYFVFDLWVSFI
jgi:sporulation integral membrane protein YlbJ